MKPKVHRPQFTLISLFVATFLCSVLIVAWKSRSNPVVLTAGGGIFGFVIGFRRGYRYALVFTILGVLVAIAIGAIFDPHLIDISNEHVH